MEDLNDYDIQEFSGDNNPALAIPGMSYGVGDMDGLAEELEWELRVAKDPYYSGKRDWITSASEHDKIVADDLAEIYQRQFCSTILSHSRGALIALMVAERLGRDAPSEIIMIAPPLNFQYSPDLQGRGEGFDPAMIDRTLHTLCATMDDETYRAMLKRHSETYGKRFHNVLTHVQDKINPFNVVSLLKNVRSSIFTVVGKNDPYHDHASLAAFKMIKREIEHKTLPLSHFMHVENPEKVAAAILDS